MELGYHAGKKTDVIAGSSLPSREIDSAVFTYVVVGGDLAAELVEYLAGFFQKPARNRGFT